jgi:hypothetical protein
VVALRAGEQFQANCEVGGRLGGPLVGQDWFLKAKICASQESKPNCVAWLYINEGLWPLYYSGRLPSNHGHKQDSQCTYEATMGSFANPLLPCKSNKYYIFQVCVALFTQHAKGMLRIVLASVACLASPNFLILLYK